MRYASGPAIVALVALMSTMAVGKGIDLDSREYKLMLVEEHFIGDALQDGVDLFISRSARACGSHQLRREGGR